MIPNHRRRWILPLLLLMWQWRLRRRYVVRIYLRAHVIPNHRRRWILLLLLLLLLLLMWQ